MRCLYRFLFPLRGHERFSLIANKYVEGDYTYYAWKNVSTALYEDFHRHIPSGVSLTA